MMEGGGAGGKRETEKEMERESDGEGERDSKKLFQTSYGAGKEGESE